MEERLDESVRGRSFASLAPLLHFFSVHLCGNGVRELIEGEGVAVEEQEQNGRQNHVFFFSPIFLGSVEGRKIFEL